MRHYIGIDLGTTNSAVCSYDGQETHIWKGPEQTDVTPSAIYIDKRGRHIYGRRAFEMSAGEKNSATLFKRYLGTNKTYHLESAGVEMSPVECSAEILKHLFHFLPDEIREDPETVTVITVPAAFNQMKKDATMEAASLAGIGQVALMQEPVAAVMSVLKKDSSEKIFLVYDLGGGTFDISVAENTGGRVSLLAQGGKEMCGGRDWDRWIYRKKILPWLRGNFQLPEDPDTDPAYAEMKKASLFAAEQAKIALSQDVKAVIDMDEDRIGTRDLAGEDIYLDIVITREDLEPLIQEMADSTVELTREIMEKAGVSKDDVGQIIFIGGPTGYKPLRDKVTEQLQIPSDVNVNPMTAVAEGASIFAESIDWEDELHHRKASRDEFSALDHITVRYEKRTASEVGKIAFLAEDETERIINIRSEDDVFHSGPLAFRKNVIVEVPLKEKGDHIFLLEITDAQGTVFPLKENRVTITRTLAAVSSIPASHSVAVKVLEKLGGPAIPVYLVEENDPLPKKGTVTFLAGQRLPAGSQESLVFTLWEGEIREPIEDNRYIGTYRIPGSLFEDGVIPAGAEIICNYEMNESGTLHLGVNIPSVGLVVNDQNFYSRFEAQTDLLDTSKLLKEVNRFLQKTGEMALLISDPEIRVLRNKLMEVRDVAEYSDDMEAIQSAWNSLLECQKDHAKIRQRFKKEIRTLDLKKMQALFQRTCNDADISEKAAF